MSSLADVINAFTSMEWDKCKNDFPGIVSSISKLDRDAYLIKYIDLLNRECVMKISVYTIEEAFKLAKKNHDWNYTHIDGLTFSNKDSSNELSYQRLPHSLYHNASIK